MADSKTNVYCDDELRPHLQHTAVEEPIVTVDVHHFSSWNRLYRAQACLLRCCKVFLARARHQSVPNGPYTAEEFKVAQNMLYRRAQRECFTEDIGTLEKKSELPKSSSLYKLSAYLDDHEVLRIRGRIDRVQGITDDFKRPIILPREHVVTKNVVASYHERFHHLNHETVINELRQKFYVFRLRQLVKSVRYRCQRCKNMSVKPTTPEMAELPSARLAVFVRPFTYVGVDCFGPITVAVGRRTEKRWGMLFTCLTIRAIHIEVAHSLTTDSCLLCIRNFMSRRGAPRMIISDNGTNFHGANNELQKSLRTIQGQSLPPEIEWRFNPPGAPHMGGSWERLIGSVKKVLSQIMPDRNPRDELLFSLLLEVENIINSRPLTFVSLEHNDDEALTPNHFLLGSSNGETSPGTFEGRDQISRKNWRRSQFLADCFWKRWIHEYLPTLTRRTKWFHDTKKIEVNDIVLVVDENLPRNTWPKGRVIEVKRGRDNVVRSATVQLQDRILVRPVVKLAVLDVGL